MIDWRVIIINIELRLRSLEARKASRNGVFVVFGLPDGTAQAHGANKMLLFDDMEDATETLHSMYDDPVVIIVDV